jgi:quercetin dioxygenase-like cupin family protein
VSVPFILGPGERHPQAPALDRPLVRITAAATNGLLGLVEVRLPPRTPGPNLHVHCNEDELFYVLSGVLTVQVGERVHDLAAGGLAWGARGTPHAFANRGDEPVHLQILYLPGGAEGVFAEMAEHRRTAAAPDDQATAAIMARYGATRVGPQLRIPDR